LLTERRQVREPAVLFKDFDSNGPLVQKLEQNRLAPLFVFNGLALALKLQ
jgi:hypothetical protein